MNPLRRDEFHESPFASSALVLFTRYPVRGQTKTRLIPVLGADGAARLQRRLTLRALRAATAFCSKPGSKTSLQIYFGGADATAIAHWLGNGSDFRAQSDGDLGRRMAFAFEKSFSDGSQATVLMGSDCPQLNTEILASAFERLCDAPVVLGPANDGGYYLIGLRHPIPQLFAEIPWGTDQVLATSLQILQRLKLKHSLLPALDDLDRPEDLPGWRRILEMEESDLGKVSVIIPALNEAVNVAAAITSAAQDKPHEILVVDGGSSDDTVRAAREAGATVLVSRPGRARQMNAGATAATGNILLFLHADTLLPPGYARRTEECLRQTGVAAGAFRFAISDPFRGRRWIEQTTNFRSHWLQIPYGDQGLFLRRSLFEELGGFADLPILEDYELVARLRRCGRVVTLPDAARTSGRRWRRLGALRTTLINSWLIGAFHLGWPISKLAATYHKKAQRDTDFKD